MNKAPQYIIRAARDEESNSGWVWIGGPSKNNPTSRIVVKITRDGYGRGVYTEARVIDPNFVEHYNSNPKRCAIDLKDDTIVMGDWYRGALGISHATPRDKKSGTVKLRVKKVSFCGSEALFAACHNPDPNVRLATRLGILGAWLGLLALVDPVLKVCAHFVEQDGRFQWLKNHLPISGTTEYLHAWAIIIILVPLAGLGIFLCRGRPQPRG
jgi:hypothetical protein